jgi:hypothetical protein
MPKFRYFLPVILARYLLTCDYTGPVIAPGHEASPGVELIGPRRVIPAMVYMFTRSASDELITY